MTKRILAWAACVALGGYALADWTNPATLNGSKQSGAGQQFTTPATHPNFRCGLAFSTGVAKKISCIIPFSGRICYDGCFNITINGKPFLVSWCHSHAR